jgi:hypothetical protein
MELNTDQQIEERLDDEIASAASYAGIFQKALSSVVKKYVRAIKRQEALHELAACVAWQAVEIDKAMNSPVPAGFEDWLLRTKGIGRGGIRCEGSVIRVPQERWRTKGEVSDDSRCPVSEGERSDD